MLSTQAARPKGRNETRTGAGAQVRRWRVGALPNRVETRGPGERAGAVVPFGAFATRLAEAAEDHPAVRDAAVGFVFLPGSAGRRRCRRVLRRHRVQELPGRPAQAHQVLGPLAHRAHLPKGRGGADGRVPQGEEDQTRKSGAGSFALEGVGRTARQRGLRAFAAK